MRPENKPILQLAQPAPWSPLTLCRHQRRSPATKHSPIFGSNWKGAKINQFTKGLQGLTGFRCAGWCLEDFPEFAGRSCPRKTEPFPWTAKASLCAGAQKRQLQIQCTSSPTLFIASGYAYPLKLQAVGKLIFYSHIAHVTPKKLNSCVFKREV